MWVVSGCWVHGDGWMVMLDEHWDGFANRHMYACTGFLRVNAGAVANGHVGLTPNLPLLAPRFQSAARRCRLSTWATRTIPLFSVA